jgi:hypothetical protein
MGWYDKQPASRQGATQNFVSSSTSQPTTTFGPQCYQIRVAVSGQAIWVKVGDTSVTASTGGDGGTLMAAGNIDYFACSPGQKAAIIGGTAGALVTVTECS